MTDADIWNLTPQQASERLAAMSLAAPAVDLAAPANIAAMSPTQARERLEGLKTNPEWQKQFLGGNGPQLREFNELSAKAAEAGDRLEAALAHGVEAAPIFETTTGDQLTIWKLGKVVADLRDDGLADDHIRELFAGEPISKELHDAARRLQQERFADPEYLDRYLKGGAEEKREQTLIGIILGRPIAEKAA
jgi:hypothetical protein